MQNCSTLYTLQTINKDRELRPRLLKHSNIRYTDNYTDKTVKEDKAIRLETGGSIIVRGNWNYNAKIKDGQYKTVREVVSALEDMPVYKKAIIHSQI